MKYTLSILFCVVLVGTMVAVVVGQRAPASVLTNTVQFVGQMDKRTETVASCCAIKQIIQVSQWCPTGHATSSKQCLEQDDEQKETRLKLSKA
ncbi:hypothetical protein Ocin01_12242 [Orchesella cincta]|uniref:Uncharacterized protein n=1 Tax=Orchesella cincta TaxID=48709 RepID=A0A1D2MN27_ORCCI|nr:hypothetical protein Ocin01_12242 [Orchesella cincta]